MTLLVDREAKRKLVRFLITGENSSGNIAAFEVVVPSAQRLAAPAHSHDHYAVFPRGRRDDQGGGWRPA